MSKEKEQINLLEYAYPDGVSVEIPGKLLEALLQILRQTVQSETSQGFIDNFPKSFKEVKNKETKILEEVQIEWTPYTSPQSYFSQQPQNIKSMLGVMAEDLLLLLQQVHLDNIENKRALKIGTLKPKINKDEIRLSSEPAN